MPHTYTVTDQVNFLESWFDSWSEFQKEDFLPVLIQALKPGEHVNGLVDGVKSLQVSGRRPSLFDCQVKLFHEWIDNWSVDEKNHFLSHIKISDPEFCDKLNQSLSQSLEKNNDSNVSIESSSHALVINEMENDKDNLVTQGSPTSSPLSSLSQPQSPQDSGLDDHHFDIEAANQKDLQTAESLDAMATQNNNVPVDGSCAKPEPIFNQQLEEIV